MFKANTTTNEYLLNALRIEEQTIKQLIYQLENNHTDHRDATLTRLSYSFFHLCQWLQIDKPGGDILG